MPVSADDLLEWHRSPGALNRLMPPWMKVQVKERAGSIEPGSQVRLRVPLAGPIGTDWVIRHDTLQDVRGFADIQQDGPFRTWCHEHRFLADGDQASTLEDRLSYSLPAGMVGEKVAGGRIQDVLDRMFDLRHIRTRNDLIRHQRAGLDEPLRIAITGSTGLVGRRLIPFLQGGGHEIVRLVRREARDADEISWDPARGEIDAAKLEGVDAVVHLAGVSIAGGRWTERRKRAIRESRVQGTSTLANALAGLKRPPRVFVSTSAVGFYGDGGSRVLDEAAPMGDGFLAEVCRDWEAAAEPARQAGIRVVHPRFGVVFAGDGGMLSLLAMVFKAGAGGPLGNGEQFMSWIAADDLVGILLESIANEELSGPVNAVSPGVVTNTKFARAMGKVLHRPTFLKTPAFAMRLAAGQLADELILASQRVVPARLDAVGFPFAFPSLEQTLRFEFGKGHVHPGESALPIEPNLQTQTRERVA
jgi:uncharacterized protein (TIGR01777 family)